MWFSSQRLFDSHLALNEKHPSCDKCDRKFADRLAYQKHLVLSPKHHYCSHCGTDHASTSELRAHVEHVAAHASWRQDHEADAGWTGGGPTAPVGPTTARSSPEHESLLSIFDCYGDRSLYHSLRAQFRIERGVDNYSAVPDAPV